MEIDVERLISNALDAAKKIPDAGKNKGAVNRNRSKNFVEELGKQFSVNYKSNSKVRVLTKHKEDNREDFGLNELLFDVLICECETTESARNGKSLTYVSHGIWAVESEMARNSRQAVYDFNKLVLSACDNQLFIGPLTSKPNDYIKPLELVAKNCHGSVFIALIPHPKDWRNDEDMQIMVRKLS